jgi:hypothetical protein
MDFESEYRSDYKKSLTIFKEERALLQSIAIYENIVREMMRSGLGNPFNKNLEDMRIHTCKSIQKLWHHRTGPISHRK